MAKKLSYKKFILDKLTAAPGTEAALTQAAVEEPKFTRKVEQRGPLVAHFLSELVAAGKIQKNADETYSVVVAAPVVAA